MAFIVVPIYEKPISNILTVIKQGDTQECTPNCKRLQLSRKLVHLNSVCFT